jgi:hypothetical protein
VTVSGNWRALTREFDDLAQREAELSMGSSRRQALRAVCSYGEKLPEFGHITISGDEIPRVRADFEDIGTRAGIRLGCPSAVRSVDFWIHSLCQDLLKTESSELSFGSSEGGVIECLVASSASYCLRLATAAAEEEHRAAGKPRLPELSDSSKRKLAIQWDSLVDRHRLATPDIDRYVGASGQTRKLAVSKPPTTSGRSTQSWLLQYDRAKRECGITPSLDAAKARFTEVAKEYWTIWESSVGRCFPPPAPAKDRASPGSSIKSCSLLEEQLREWGRRRMVKTLLLNRVVLYSAGSVYPAGRAIRGRTICRLPKLPDQRRRPPHLLLELV